MNFRRMTFGVLILFLLSTVASAQQLTKADLQGLENRVQALEIKVSNLEIKVEEMDKRLTTAINILIGVILAAIALPQVLGYLQAKREREEFQKQLHDLRTEMRESRTETQQQSQDLRTEMRQEIQNLRTEMRDQRAELRQEIQALGERLERQFQLMFEKLGQQQQEIDALKSRRIVTPS